MSADLANLIAAGLAFMGLVLAIWAAIVDYKTYLIPNWISFSILILGVAFGLVRPEFAWGWHIFATALVFAIGFVLFAFRLFGGGDVKLMTAITFWAGFETLYSFALVTALFGGILSLGYIIRAYWRARREEKEFASQLASLPIPYGIAIAVGGVYVFLMIQGHIGIVL